MDVGITGDPGTGKSVALRLLASRLARLRDVTVGSITHPQVSSISPHEVVADVHHVIGHLGIVGKSGHRLNGYIVRRLTSAIVKRSSMFFRRSYAARLVTYFSSPRLALTRWATSNAVAPCGIGDRASTLSATAGLFLTRRRLVVRASD